MYLRENISPELRHRRKVVIFMTVGFAVVAVMLLFPRSCANPARFAGMAPGTPGHAGPGDAGRRAARAQTDGPNAKIIADSKRDRRRAAKGRDYSADKIPPEISLRLLNGRRNHLGEYGPRLRLMPMARDRESGIRVVQWRRGPGDAWKTYRRPVNPYGRARRLRGRLEFRARDRAGNVSRISRFTFRIDDVPPAMPFIYVGRRGTRGGNLPPREGILIPTIEPRARMHYRLGAGPYRPCAPGARLKVSGEGNRRITFRVSDEVGNSRTSIHMLQLDNTPPRTTIQAN